MVLFLDEAGIKLDADLRRMWSPKGQQPLILTHSPHGRVNLIGFVNPKDGQLFINRIERGNAENFIEQLEFIRSKFTNFQVKLYVDNARWHKTESVFECIKKNPTIQICFLPKYAPKLNPMERHWWYLRKKKTQNKVFDSEEDCWNAIVEHLATIEKDEIIRICQI